MAAPDQESFGVRFKRRLPQYIAASAACLGGFSLGCGLGWSAPCVEILKEEHEYDQFATDLVASVFPLGAALGIIVVPFLIDKIGRKWTMLSLVPPFLLGWVLITVGVSVVVLMAIGRLITGACGGMFCVVAPMYSAEISEKQIRGRLGVFFQLLLVFGILFAFCCGYAKNVAIISSLCGGAPLLFASVMIFMPESPLYYIMKDNEAAARKAMLYFRGPDFDIEPEIREFKEQVEKTRAHKVSIEAFMHRPILKTMMLAYGMMFAQQFSGINAIIFYCESVFRLTGVDLDSMFQMVIVAVVQVEACLISAALIDKLGRKILMLVSMGVMGVCLGSLAIFFLVKSSDSEQASGLSWLPLVATCTYILAFCLGAGPIPWAYMGEIFPPNIKGAASSSAAFFNWMLAFIVTVSFSTAVRILGSAATFFFFAFVCLGAFVFLMFFMIETKGKTFVEIQQELGIYGIYD
ncbi:facilitated trehalose transporter Tret1 isoform X3 [Ceratina calcarata]|uniref:Facilitated trehalose transporter Tret1 isoform X3 n=1 Tax=Ceratina calcarata TaxID=156304 RepID=A0AAJ7NDD9_9HYME|nr:facilitated trehalose transporter Tret1 isoform X3 [Ceratina calcarata]